MLTSALGLAATGLFFCAVTALTGGPALWATEDGAFEWSSFLFLLAAPVAFLAVFPAQSWLFACPIPVFTLLLAMREGQSPWWIVDERLLGPEFYLAEGLSPRSVAGAAIVALLTLAVFMLFWRGFPAFARGLRARTGWALVLTAGFICTALAQLLEEAHGLPFVEVAWRDWLVLGEEALEMVFAFSILEAVLRGGLAERQAV